MGVVSILARLADEGKLKRIAWLNSPGLHVQNSSKMFEIHVPTVLSWVCKIRSFLFQVLLQK